MANADFVLLSKEQNEGLRDALFDFVLRVTLGKEKVSNEELLILPQTAKLLLDYFGERN